MKEIYAVLDIGSTTIKLLVAETVSANINILFSKKIPSHGVVKGNIKDMDALVKDVRAIVKEAETELKTTIRAVALVVPSIDAKVYLGDGITKVNSPNDRISVDDVLRALKLSRRFELSKNEDVVCTIPVRYHTDTRTMQKVPLGVKSASLKADTMIITQKKSVLYAYLQAVEASGLELLDITIDAYASAKEAFDEAYLQEGAILIDIGYHSSTIAFFEDGCLKYLSIAHVGGYDLTKAIAESWDIPLDKAELYKVKYGTCERDLSDDDIIHVTKTDDGVKRYTQADLSAVLQKAVSEMMEVIKTKIDVINDGRNYETLIIGGGGELPYLDQTASDVLGSPVRSYRPETIGARDMSYVPALGMIYYIRDRKELLGENAVSLTLPDISSTMNLRLKGLTKAKTEEKHKGRIRRLMDTFFSEED